MSSNPFRPTHKETFEDQLDMSSRQQHMEDVPVDSSSAPVFMESSTSSASSGGLLGPMKTTTTTTTSVTSSAPTAAASSIGTKMCAFLSVEYYRPYFDVSSKAVLERIKGGVNPKAESIFSTSEECPADLYGSFWISTTLVFLIGATSNLNSYLAHNSSKEPWDRDYRILTFASTLVYGYAYVIPMLIWGATLYVGIDPRPSLLRLVAIYGYVLASFLPASLLCVIPSAPVQWIVVLVAMLLSGAVLMKNLRGLFLGGSGYAAVNQIGDLEGQVTPGDQPQNKPALALVTFTVLLHAVFALMLKLFFFQGADLQVVEGAKAN